MSSSTLVVFGAGGRVGRAVTAEAVARGLSVTAAVRSPERHADLAGPQVTVVGCDVSDAEAVAEAAAGHGAAVSSLYRADVPSQDFYGAVTEGLLAGLGRAGTGRLVSVGMAATLETAPGVRVMDDPEFPAEWRTFSLGHALALDLLATRAPAVLDWLVLTPPMDLGHDGVRTGRYQLGGRAFPEGGGHISHADYAIAVLDQIERPSRHRTQISVYS
ncbi:NAD(P)-dependent oxidoreductase [Kitasatospora sp. NPDC001175]|uniref:NAD(P)-dependent oxidoreductase n=1 Tax=Kitasatospora sp. NPDC001175 TaxID=3157103 RepID=UPI003D0011B3